MMTTLANGHHSARLPVVASSAAGHEGAVMVAPFACLEAMERQAQQLEGGLLKLLVRLVRRAAVEMFLRIRATGADESRLSLMHGPDFRFRHRLRFSDCSFTEGTGAPHSSGLTATLHTGVLTFMKTILFLLITILPAGRTLHAQGGPLAPPGPPGPTMTTLSAISGQIAATDAKVAGLQP